MAVGNNNDISARETEIMPSVHATRPPTSLLTRRIGWHTASLHLKTGLLLLESRSDGPIVLEAAECLQLLSLLWAYQDVLVEDAARQLDQEVQH